MKATGIVLIIIGIVLTIFTTVKFFTKEKVADLGVIEITTNKPHNVSWPPFVGIIVIGVGGLVLWQASKKS